MKLQDYDFTLQYIPGKTNTKADILLRKDQINTKKDRRNESTRGEKSRERVEMTENVGKKEREE